MDGGPRVGLERKKLEVRSKVLVGESQRLIYLVDPARNLLRPATRQP